MTKELAAKLRALSVTLDLIPNRILTDYGTPKFNNIYMTLEIASKQLAQLAEEAKAPSATEEAVAKIEAFPDNYLFRKSDVLAILKEDDKEQHIK